MPLAAGALEISGDLSARLLVTKLKDLRRRPLGCLYIEAKQKSQPVVLNRKGTRLFLRQYKKLAASQKVKRVLKKRCKRFKPSPIPPLATPTPADTPPPYIPPFKEKAQSNLRSGISLLVEGRPDIDFAEEYLYHDQTLDDTKVLYLKGSTLVRLSHNERNVIGGDIYYLQGASCMESPYCKSAGWHGLDGEPGSGDEAVLGTVGQDGVTDSGDEGIIYFRVDRDEQACDYAKITFDSRYDPPGLRHIQYINALYQGPFSFDLLHYEPGIKVLGTLGSNGGAYGARPSATYERYQRGMLDSFGDEWHVLRYWDNDYSILSPASARAGYVSDGGEVYVVVNPRTPVIKIMAPEGEEFFTTQPAAYHIPRLVPQTSYATSGAFVKLVNLANSKPLYYRWNEGTHAKYVYPLALNQLPIGENTLRVWIEGGPVKERRIIIDPAYPSDTEVHPNLIVRKGAELEDLQQKMQSDPFKTYFRSFKRDTETGKAKLSFPLTYRGSWRGIMAHSRNIFNFSSLYYLDSTLSMEADPSFAVLAKRGLLSLVGPGFIGSEIVSNNRPGWDAYDIPNSGHNVYANLGLAYDLLIGAFKKDDHALGISPIEDLKIRDQLARTVHVMIKFADNKSLRGSASWDGQTGGNMHWRLGEQLVAYVLAAAMPTYDSPVFGTSGFDGSPGRHDWAPFKGQTLSWLDILTDANLEERGHPGSLGPAAYNFTYNTFAQLLNYPRDPGAKWDLPPQGVFWQAANGFAGATRLFSFGQYEPCDLVFPEMIELPVGDLGEYTCDGGSRVLSRIRTMEGNKLQTQWNRSFNLPTVTGPQGGLFAVEFGGYETPFVSNLLLAHYLHRRLFGFDMSPRVSAYLETKFNRALGNFDPKYLNDMQPVRTSDVVYTYQSGQYSYPLLSDPQWLTVSLPLNAFNPGVTDLAGALTSGLNALASEYPSIWNKKFYNNPLGYFLFDHGQE